MALTYSSMIALGTKAPAFTLEEPLTKRQRALADLVSKKATVVMFICNHCPYVKHVQQGLVQLTNEYLKKGVAFVAISSNDVVAYPDDSPAKMAEEARRAGYAFPYLFDADQKVAKAYGATCTPDFFVYDAQLALRYRGQMDGSRPKSDVPVTGADLRAALDALLAGKLPSAQQTASCGCNIKWRE